MKRSIHPALGPMEVRPVNSKRLTPVNPVDRERAWLGLIPRALGRAGLSHQQAAGALGISGALFSAQLSAVEKKHLSFRRMWNLPPEFWRELIVLICEFHDVTVGGTQQDAEDAAVGRLFREAMQRVNR